MGELRHIAVYSHFVFNALWVIQHVPKIDAGASDGASDLLRNQTFFLTLGNTKSTLDFHGSENVLLK